MRRNRKLLLLSLIAFLGAGCSVVIITGMAIPWRKVSVSGSDSHGSLDADVWIFRRISPAAFRSGESPYLIKKITIRRASGVWWTSNVGFFYMHDFPSFDVSKRGLSFSSHQQGAERERFDGCLELPVGGIKVTRAYVSSPQDESYERVEWNPPLGK
jgi:hypothetical protein